jgi:hypothetical protein
MNEFNTPESAEEPVATPWAPPADHAPSDSDATDEAGAAAFSETATAETGDPVAAAEVGEAGEAVGLDSPSQPGKKARSLRRTLVFAGAATALGLAIGTAVGVAADGHHAPKRTASAGADAASTNQAGAARFSPTQAGGQWDGHDYDGGRGGFGGPHGDRHGGPGGDRQNIGSPSANGPVGARPGQGPSSSSHGS